MKDVNMYLKKGITLDDERMEMIKQFVHVIDI